MIAYSACVGLYLLFALASIPFQPAPTATFQQIGTSFGPVK